MARLRDKGVQAALNAAKVWRERCLETDGSIFTNRPLWTPSNVEAVEHAFFGNLIYDPTRSFIDKLREQMASLPADAPRLVAELTWVMLLFPSRINSEKKCDDVREIWSWSNEALPRDHPMLADLARSRVGHTGVAFNTLRWREFGFMVRSMRRFKQEAAAERARLLQDPWVFAAWLDQDEESHKRPMRHLLVYLLFPDFFERIAAGRQKRTIVRFFLGELDGRKVDERELSHVPAVDIDRQLHSIRDRLQLKYPGTELDFYQPPLSEQLRKATPSKPVRASAQPELPFDPDSSASAELVLIGRSKSEARRAIVTCLAECIERAHQLNPHRWSVVLSPHRVRLTVGRVLVFAANRSGCRLTVLADRLSAEESNELRDRVLAGEPFSVVSGAHFFAVKEAEFLELIPRVKPALNALIEAAVQTAKTSLSARAHSPAVLDFLDRFMGRAMPRPASEAAGDSKLGDVPPATLVSSPRSGFRATELDLAALVSDIDNGDIGLPDIQRPFVWTNAKVRDLFDSMYRGYPVGYLLFWEAAEPSRTSRFIGTNGKAFRSPKRLIVDGQQRLTSLFAVMRGREVLDDDYHARRIEIAFRPRDGRFEVADAAIRRDPEYLPDVSAVLMDDRGSYSVISEFRANLTRRRSLTPEEQQIVGKNLERLFGLKQYRFSILEISAELPEEAVADIFVRINSEGVKLNQADFILTLLSVFWEDGRRQLEEFSRNAKRPPEKPGVGSPYNHLFHPSPDQLLRVAIALGFARARLKAVYQLLRGKNPDTGALEPERRDEQLANLKSAQAVALDIENWQRFLSCVTATGFRIAEQVPSDNALVMAYALYLYGRTRAALEPKRLDRLIGQWFVMSVVTSRYSGSTETVMEQDLYRIARATQADAFAAALQAAIEGALTGDFWKVTLPMELESSGVSRSPGWAAFVAAQIRLSAPVLFSDKSVWMTLDPLTRGHRKPLEVHHLFPKNWLLRQRISDRKQTDQVANMALLEWPDNARAGNRGPTEYVPDLRSTFDESQWQRMCRLHALPPDWEKLDYAEFLRERRILMAGVIRRAFDDLAGESAVAEHDGASTSEEAAWSAISSVEKRLRRIVGSAYRSKWGAAFESQLRTALGDASWSTIEKNRDKHRRQYPLTSGVAPADVFDYLYLGQLISLMLHGAAWDQFRTAFRDKRQLEDLANAIIPVRNDAAHFRSVPTKELQRCVIAVDDLLRILSSLPGGER